MMTGVDLRSGGFFGREKRRQPRARMDLKSMGLVNIPPGLVIDRSLQVLNQGAIAPDIESLNAVTDSKDRLFKIERVLQQKLIHRRAAWVGFLALRNSLLAIRLRIDVVGASRQQNAMYSRKQASHSILALVQWNQD